MKRLITFLFCLVSLSVYSQQKDLTDSTEFRYGLPVSNDDTTQRVRTEDDPANEWVAVRANKIPKKLRRSLERNSVYQGWEKGEIFYDRKIDQYLVRIREARAVRTYGFSAEGDPVSFAEENIVSTDSLD